MVKRCWPGVLLLAGLACLSGLPGVTAEDKKKPADDKKKPVEVAVDPTAEDLRHLASALDLAAMGNTSGEMPAPELLIAAARVLRSVRTLPAKEKATTENSLEEPLPLLAESDWLLKEARKLGKKNALIAKLADSVGESDSQLTEAQKVAADNVRHIATALDIAALGRKEKAPELLVAAAEVLRGIIVTPGKEKATVKGKDEKKGKAEPPSLKKESDKLLDEAQKMAPDNKALAEWIEQVKLGGRGSTAGPKTDMHEPAEGATITLNLEFKEKEPALVSVQGNGRNLLTLTVTEVRESGDGPHASRTALNPSISWVPKATKTFKIEVTNTGPGSCTYTLYHN